MARKIRKHALPGDIACCHGPGIKALNCCDNDGKCQELGWVVVECYGSWGPEAKSSLSKLAGHLH